MKKLFFIAAVGIAALACTRENASVTRSISIRAQIGDVTKVTTTGDQSVFQEGDKISLYAWTGSATSVSSPLVVDGVKNSLGSDGKWTAETQMLWADMVTPHYFIGVYPARKVTDFKADTYTLNPADYEASDLLIAKNVAGLKAQDDPVVLAFDHVVAKLYVNLTFRNQWTTEPTVTAVTATAKKTATVDYLTETLSATGTAGPVALTASANNAWNGLQVPQTGVNTITVTLEGKDYVYTHTADIPLQGGKYTTVNLVIGRDQINLASEITISNWASQGDAINGDVFKPAE